MKAGPLSLTTISGGPNMLKTLALRALRVSSAVVLVTGMNNVKRVSAHVTTRCAEISSVQTYALGSQRDPHAVL